MTFASVFLVSLSTLFFEVLINRAFAITQWSHLAFMVIGIAMFGLSAGSMWVHVRMFKRTLVRKRHLTGPAIAAGASIIISWICVNLIPFNTIELPFSRIQIVYLALVFLFLSLPFFFAGVVSAAGFASESGKPGGVYAASMTGSAAGALLPVALLPAIGFTGCIIFAAFIPVLPVLAGGNWKSRAAAAAATVAVLSLLFFPALLEPQPSSYKELERYLQHPGAEITSRKDTINGRVETYTGTGFRSAPGLSLSYTGDIPSQTGVFIDSSSPMALYAGSEPEDFNFALESVGAAAYTALPDPQNVLVYLESGGSAIAAAVASSAAEVTIIDRNKTRAAIIAHHYEAFDISVIPGPPRQRLAATQKHYDIIAVDHLGTTTPGLISINEDYTLTIESMQALYGKLTAKGIVTISRRLQVPPSDSLKLFATVYTALKRAGVPDPASNMCMLRTFNIYTLLFSREPFSAAALSHIRTFAEDLSFDLVLLKGLEPAEANRFNRRDQAIYFERIARLHGELESSAAEYSSGYILNISEASDNSPYFNRFIRWTKIDDLYEVTGRRSHAFYFTGEILIVAVFAISLMFSISIIMTPALVIGLKKARAQILSALAFACIGTGFMFFELAWIKRIPPVTGDLTSFAAVIASLLVTSGVGGWASERVKAGKLPSIAVGATIAVVVSAGAMHLIMPIAPALPSPLAWMVTLLPAALPGFFMGMLLPLIMRSLCRSDGERVFGWAVNGTFSVLASTLAAGVALFAGLQSLVWIAAALYGVTALTAVAGTRLRST